VIRPARDLIELFSMLYVPGGDERKVAKAATLNVPAIILDLEDAVAASAKVQARAAVAAAIAAGATAAIWVRVNSSPPESQYGDMKAIVRPGLDGIVLPKVECAGDVARTAWLLEALEQEAGLTQPVQLLATIETVKGLANADSIATASPRIRWLGFGAGDFSLDLGLEWPPKNGALSGTVLAAKSEIVLASRRAGLQPPHDGAYPRFRDHDGLRRESDQAAALGFGGKHAIHPDQVPVIRSAFVPGADELRAARDLVADFDRQEKQGVGNVSRSDQLVDYPVAERARRLLDRAARHGELITSDRSEPS
jgi:citrate lyase subunit beta / citryl-CoA lyase